MKWDEERLVHLIELMYANEDVFQAFEKGIRESENLLKPFEYLYEENFDRYPHLPIAEISVVFTIISKCISEYNRTPENIDFLKNIGTDIFATVEIPKYSKSKIGNIIKRCCKNKTQLSNRIGEQRATEIMDQFIADFYFKSKIISLVQTHKNGAFNLSPKLRNMSDIIDGCSPGAPPEYYGLELAETMLDEVVSSKTGLDFLERLMPDGFVSGDVILLAGPTGTGKTTFCVQAAMDVAVDNGGFVAHFTYEEAFERKADPKKVPKEGETNNRSELTARAIACKLGISRTRTKKGLTNLSEAEIANIRDLSSGPCGRDWKIIDMTKAKGAKQTFEGMKDKARKCHEERHIDLLIIDPFWDLVMVTAMWEYTNPSLEQIRSCANDIAAKLKDFADELGVPILVTHQVSAEGAKDNPKKVSSYCLAESRVLMWKWTVGLVMTKMDENNQNALVFVKGRSQGEVGAYEKLSYDRKTSSFELRKDNEAVNKLDVGGLQSKNMIEAFEDISGQIESQPGKSVEDSSGILESEPEPDELEMDEETIEFR